MQHRFIAPFSAALLAGALAACPAFAQMEKPDPSTQTATKSEQPSGTYAGVKIDHGPGVIPDDAPKGAAGLAETRTGSVRTAADRRMTGRTVVRSSKSDPSIKAATKSENPNGTNMYADVTIDHGPGVIPHDAPKGAAGLAVNAAAPAVTTPAPAWRGEPRPYAYGTGYYGEDYNGGFDVGFGAYPVTAYGYGYGPSWGYAYEPGEEYGYGRRCYQRRVLINQRYWEWRRFCE